ncbi:transposase [Chryseobacterium sp. SORGH_AS_0447]|uniref:transposase n=1 Tax=Chryseobacterium sp. SORGH_AS_0447 TaxID=3041769 RepID=UPI0027D77125|nr:transposase [Chryseobacterium sp. SORGH_AS_0447]
MIRNKKQLTSYAGFDVKEKISGTSVKGKPRISKRGNKHLRRTMYFPAITAIRSIPAYKAIYIRIVERTGIKMKGIVAVARKLLELMYVIFKTEIPYQNDYDGQKNKGAKSENESCSILAGS